MPQIWLPIRKATPQTETQQWTRSKCFPHTRSREPLTASRPTQQLQSWHWPFETRGRSRETEGLHPPQMHEIGPARTFAWISWWRWTTRQTASGETLNRGRCFQDTPLRMDEEESPDPDSQRFRGLHLEPSLLVATAWQQDAPFGTLARFQPWCRVCINQYDSIKNLIEAQYRRSVRLFGRKSWICSGLATHAKYGNLQCNWNAKWGICRNS